MERALTILAVMLGVCVAQMEEEKGSLFFVAHLANVGARFPEEINGDWVKRPGELTPVGMRQLYLLGRELRKRYIEDTPLISEQYNPYQFILRSSHKNRTTEASSAYAFARGLYLPGSGYSLTQYQIEHAVPPTNFTNYSEYQEELRDAALLHYFGSLPAMIYSGGPDYRLLAHEYCNSLEGLVGKFKEKDEGVRRRRSILMDEFRGVIFPELTKAFGVNVDSMKLALAYRDYIIAAKHYAHDLGVKISPEGMKQLDVMYTFCRYEESMGNEKVARIVSNGVLEEVTKHLRKSLGNKDKSTRLGMVSYMVTDTNILAMLRLLSHNMTTGNVLIPFASSLQLEVYQTSKSGNGAGSYVVRALFNGRPIKLNEKDYEVEVGKWLDWAGRVMVPDFMKECKVEIVVDEGSDTPWVIVAIIVGILMLAMLAVTMIYIMKRTPDEDSKVEAINSDEIKLSSKQPD